MSLCRSFMRPGVFEPPCQPREAEHERDSLSSEIALAHDAVLSPCATVTNSHKPDAALAASGGSYLVLGRERST